MRLPTWSFFINSLLRPRRAPDSLREILTGSPESKETTKQCVQRGGFEGSLQFRNTRLARLDQKRKIGLTERAHLAKLADGFRQRNFHLDPNWCQALHPSHTYFC